MEHAEEFARHGIRIKCYDVYFSRNAAFLWIDTLYPELDQEAWQYGLKMRADYSEYLCSHYGSPGGILAPLAEHIMPKMGGGFGLMRTAEESAGPQRHPESGRPDAGRDGPTGQMEGEANG